MKACLIIGSLFIPACFSGIYAAEVSTAVKTQKETLNKLNLLGYILLKSKRAKEVRASGNDKAITILEMARKHYNTAKILLNKGDLDASNNEIQKSLQNISVSFRMVVDTERAIELAREQYALLQSRVKSFRQLFNQLPVDKTKGILDSKKLERLIQEAESIYAKNQPERALPPLLEVADMLERALSAARKNETVVYALKFSTLKEEYKYELERNENYTLLANIILSASSSKNSKKLPLIRRLLNKNKQLRLDAEKQFESEALEKAIILLEKGNKILVRALRLGGLAL